MTITLLLVIVNQRLATRHDAVADRHRETAARRAGRDQDALGVTLAGNLHARLRNLGDSLGPSNRGVRLDLIDLVLAQQEANL
jgi:hypothetical protein